MTSADFILAAAIGLMPVLAYLLVLRFLDSYKLVTLQRILAIIGLGGLVASAGYAVNDGLMDLWQMDIRHYSRYVAPVVEEGLKALAVVYLFRSNRIGFLVDAAILGFAVGAGFAIVENFYLLSVLPDTHMGVWIVRGFGTAIMHGGVTAIFAMISQALTERSMKLAAHYFLPGLLLAVGLHSLFNHFFFSPLLSAILILVMLPPIFYLVFQQSARALHDWLHLDFDADADLIEQISSGNFTESKIGFFLTDLKDKFQGPVVADMLCYLRVYTELALRAKGLLLMREHGIEAPIGERTQAKFEELKYLEDSIGTTGCLAMRPFLQMDRKDLWQINVLQDTAERDAGGRGS